MRVYNRKKTHLFNNTADFIHHKGRLEETNEITST